jgi:rubrerythrin
MDAKEFVAGLVDEMQGLFRQLGERETLESESAGRLEIPTLLKLALTGELEASELAGYWMPTTPELDAKRVLAEQCGDEMRHYELIARRLEELGEELSEFDPLAEGYSPLQQYLQGLNTTVERIAGGPFAREAIAEVRNAQFIEFCRAAGDDATADMYEKIIQPEEVGHHRMGRMILEKYAVTDEQQEAAAAAVRNTLAIADELRTLKTRTTGDRPIPLS